MLWQANSELADTLAKESQKAVRERYEHYLALASDAFTKK
jgi:hypothetical protein